MKLSPHWYFIFFTLAVILLFFLFILESTDLIEPADPMFYKVLTGIAFFFFFWWPFDMILHWEKRTPASFEKDRYIAMIAITIILFVFPYQFLATPLWPTLGGAVLIGLVFPGAFIILAKRIEKTEEIDPSKVYQLGMESPKAQEFRRYYPDCKRYVIGLSQAEGLFAKLILHHREATDAIKNGFIDFVLEVPVHREKQFYIGGKEVLQCYIFFNNEMNAMIGFLPSSNMGRAYDFGFSDDEIENALMQANEVEQKWPPLKDKPLNVEHFPGKVVDMN